MSIYSRLHCSTVAVGDINLDGLPDVVGWSDVYVNTGNANFSKDFNPVDFGLPVNYDINIGPQSAWASALGDLDGDSFPDTNDVYRNGDDAEGYSSTVFFDFEKDGDLDIFVAPYFAFGFNLDGEPQGVTPSLLINDGAGNFSDSGLDFSNSLFYHPIATLRIADFDGNGFDDVLVVDFGLDGDPFPGNQNRIFMQYSGGVLEDETETRLPRVNDISHGVAIGDIDGDDDLDIFVVNLDNSPHSPHFLINNGDGFFDLEE